MKLALKNAKKNVSKYLFSLSTRYPKFSSIYFVFFSNDFEREHFSVVNGQKEYEKENSKKSSNRYLLRRNIHRIEKGLLMRPRRSIFGLEYLKETVDCYCKAITDKDNSCFDELQWAHDVLFEYFDVSGQHDVVNDAKNKFFSSKSLKSDQPKRIPYKRAFGELSNVEYEEFLNLAKQRRSVRWYLPKPVPRSLIDKAILAAALSPSACNRQPFEFRVFDEPELVEKISKLPLGTKGFNQNFPSIVVVVGKLRAYFSARDRHIIYIDSSLASMSFMFALETLGLSSCPINWPDIEHLEEKMSNLLKLDNDERVIMLISVGYPDPEGSIAFSQKKSLSDMRRYNFE